MNTRCLAALCGVLCGAMLPSIVRAQILQYPDPSIYSIYPAGGQRGETLKIEIRGVSGLKGASQLIIDGPPGVTASDVECADGVVVKAKLAIAADAAPGRRKLRVAGGENGLTNCRDFYVGTLPEVLEKEPNNAAESPQEITQPAVVNGRLNPSVDVDCFRFEAKKGESIVTGVVAYQLGATLGNGKGFLDTSLEVLDERGNVLAADEDSLGIDPLVLFSVPADGKYVVRIRALGYKGSDHAVYRLIVGANPCPTAVFPAGGRCGENVEVELSGPNVPAGTRRGVSVSPGAPESALYLSFAEFSGDVPFVRGEYPEVREAEPNSDRSQAARVTFPVTVNGRFLEPGDEDWYRVSLEQGKGIILRTQAQRILNAPVDTLIEIYGPDGKKLAENDDGAHYANECLHDFASSDSWLEFTPAAAGDFDVRVRNQSNVAGPRAVYRLTIEPLQPDFKLHQWPDAVPIWGPGTTASFLVQFMHWGGMKADIQLRVEGLPAGWKASVGNVPARYYAPYVLYLGTKSLITLTAPPDAPRGTVVSFRVIGRAEQEGRVIEHEAHYMTLTGNSHNDRMHLHESPSARAAIAMPLDSWLETPVTELSVRQNSSVEIPVKLHRAADAKLQIGVVTNGPTVAASVAWQAPLLLKPDQSDVMLPLKVSAEQQPGTYGIVVARSWSSDIRGGRPGPCTPLILLTVLPAEGK